MDDRRPVAVLPSRRAVVVRGRGGQTRPHAAPASWSDALPVQPARDGGGREPEMAKGRASKEGGPRHLVV